MQRQRKMYPCIACKEKKRLDGNPELKVKLICKSCHDKALKVDTSSYIKKSEDKKKTFVKCVKCPKWLRLDKA